MLLQGYAGVMRLVNYRASLPNPVKARIGFIWLCVKVSERW